MRISTQKSAPTFESVWAAIQETNLQMQETDRRMQETDRRMQETDRQIQETDRLMQETVLRMQETDRQMREMRKDLGSWANNHGSFAEEYFFNSFENGEQNFFGEKFDLIKKGVKSVLQDRSVQDEYDIVLYNSSSIAIVEVKFKAHKDHISKLETKAGTFRILFPYYRDFKIYLGLASMSFHAGVEQECIDKGIAVIKQVGDTVVINDEHLRVF